MHKLKYSKVLERFKKVHGDRYNYDNVVYVNTRTKVEILCPVHGSFWQLPSIHMQGRGCVVCGNKRSGETRLKDKKIFENQAIMVHGNKYWYFSQYLNDSTKTQIYCVTCQKGFWQKPNAHLQGSGCPTCGRAKCHISKKLTPEEMEKRANEIHGNKYWYFSPFIDRQSPVHIYCLKCSKGFWQIPAIHLNGAGCVTCANHGGFDPSKPGILYYLRDTTNNLYKIGITNRTVKERFHGKNKIIFLIKTWYFEKGVDALELEQFLHKECSGNQIINENFLGNGSTEFFDSDILNLDTL